MKIAATDLEIEVRPGTVDDIPLLLSFIHSMAEFERLEVHATEKTLRESLFGDHPAAHTLLAFADDDPVAYGVYFFSFATMVGKRGLWLDDLYVKPDYRGKGIAKALMAYLADLAIQNECGRFEWIVLDWNKSAIDFYHGMGAAVLDDWRICRLDEDQLVGIAEKLVRVDGGEYTTNVGEHRSAQGEPEFKYRGARVLAALHEEHLRRFVETWKTAKASGVGLPRVDDPDYVSFEALLRHVFRWARTYLRWICEQLGLPDPGIKTVPEADVIESEAPSYLEHLLDAWRSPLRDVEKRRFFKPEYVSPWGVKHSVEAMLEHAVMHPMRHRYQLEELIGIRRHGTP